jgi:hypothetical protein
MILMNNNYDVNEILELPIVRLLSVVTTKIRSTSVAAVFRQLSDFFTDCMTKLKGKKEALHLH